MSIIEKAMNKLEGARLHRRSTATESPTIVEHPAFTEVPYKTASLVHGPPSTDAQTYEERTHHLHVARLKADGLIASHELSSQVADEFGQIKRPLLANAFGKGASHVERGNLVVVTSSVPGEGKTFTSINLALSVALERDHTVLLIDADMAKRDVSRLYGLEKAPGLTDILLGDRLDLSEVTCRTDGPDLSIVPTGRRHPHAAELLASNEMERLVAKLADTHPDLVVIFDSPPMLATSEPQVLAGLVGQIVLVVEAQRTPQDVVKAAIATLAPSKAINLVLNKGQYDAYRSSSSGSYYEQGGE